MPMVQYWKTLRVLTTDKCNYQCVFCHNEGQNKNNIKKSILKYKDFKSILDVLVDCGIKEVQFSGGEPFMNPETIEMIEYANNINGLDIGCASNISLLSDYMIERLSQTRIKMNVQFPSIVQESFTQITRTGTMKHVVNKLLKMKYADIPFGLNHVLQTADSNDFSGLLDFAFSIGCDIKLLPQIGDGRKDNFKGTLFPIIEKYSISKTDRGDGSYRFILKCGNTIIKLLYIDAPCISRKFEQCKNFAEIRLLPEMAFQPCIMKENNIYSFHVDDNESITKAFNESWWNFVRC